MRRITGLVLGALLVSAGCADGSGGEPRRSIILDYSPTVSDIGALAFVASHPDLELLAVTLPGRGESFCAQGVAHTRGVLIELGLPDVPVACSESDLPLEGLNSFPVDWRKGANALDLPSAEPNEDRFAAELIIDIVKESKWPVEILAVGPLTNLAVAFEKDPSLPERLDGVTIMGGAVDVPGNVFANPYAEWNIWVDPVAAARVFASGVDLTVIPLDATAYLPANGFFFEALDRAADGSASTIVRDLIAHDPFWLAGGFFFWDELAAAVLADESVVTFESQNLVVDTGSADSEGRLRRAVSGSPARVAVAADRRAFEQLYADTLVGGSVELPYVDATEEEIAYFEEVARIIADVNSSQDRIFTATAESLGLGESTDDDAFVEVVTSALPAIFDGPWADHIRALEVLVVPEGLIQVHSGWLSALRSFAAARDEVIAAFAGNFDDVAPLLEPVIEACGAVQDAADLRLVDVALECFE